MMISTTAASPRPTYSCDRLNINMMCSFVTEESGNEGAIEMMTEVCFRFAAVHTLAPGADRSRAHKA